MTGLSSANVPLANLLPTGAPGCSLLVSPDAIAAIVPTAGVATDSLAVPYSLALVGTIVHHQFLGFDISGQGAWVGSYASNALTATIGYW